MGMTEESLETLVDKIAARTPTPGGGSAAPLAAALGIALGTMAIRFTQNRKSTDAELAGVLATVETATVDLAQRFAAQADEDSRVYEAWRNAKQTAASGNDAAVQEALDQAAEVPLRTAKLCRDGLEMLEGLAKRLNPHLATDVASAAMLLHASGRCALQNVRVNVGSLVNAPRRSELSQAIEQLQDRCQELESNILGWTDSVLEK